MPSSERSCVLPFTPASDLTSGLHLYAAVGGGAPHLFEVDTGSVGVLVPRQSLGPAYQNFDRSLDVKFEYVSSGKVYWGQWVKAAGYSGRAGDMEWRRRLPHGRGRDFRSRPAD